MAVNNAIGNVPNSASSFFRGDGTWAIPDGGAGGPAWPAMEVHAATRHDHPTVLPRDALQAETYARLMHAYGLALVDQRKREAKAWTVQSRWDLIRTATNAVTGAGFVAGGSTDNTTALANWIAAASPGAALYLPPGTYRLNGPVNITKGITLVGAEGTIITTPVNYGGNGVIQCNVNGSVGAEVDGIHIVGIRFTGAGNEQDQVTIRARYTSHLHIENCYFYNWGYTIIELLDAQDALIENCVFDDFNYTGDGYGIYVGEYSDNVVVRHNYFVTEAGRHSITTGAIGAVSSSDWCHRLIIDDNYIENSTSRAIDAHEMMNGPYIVTNNLVYNCAGFWSATASRNGAVLRGNIFLEPVGDSTWAIGQQAYLAGTSILIENNVIEGGVALFNNPAVVIANNVFLDDGVLWKGAVSRLDLVGNIYRDTLCVGYEEADPTPTVNVENVQVTSTDAPGVGAVLASTATGWALSAGGGGEPGADGRTVLNGTGVPGSGLGADGDFYIDTATWTIYGPKASGAWGTGTSLVGPAGEDGEDGADGAPGGGGAAPWTDAGAFSRTANSTFTVTDNATNQGIYQKGRPIRYRATASTWRYGIVTAYASGTVTLAGAPMTAGDDDEIQYGDMTRVVQVPVFIPGYFEDAADTTLIASDLGQELTWGQGTAYLVRVRARNRIADTGATDATVNVHLGGSATLSTPLTLAANATWYTSAVAVSTTNYEVSFDEVVEVSTTKGTNGNAQDLSVQMTFVVV